LLFHFDMILQYKLSDKDFDERNYA